MLRFTAPKKTSLLSLIVSHVLRSITISLYPHFVCQYRLIQSGEITYISIRAKKKTVTLFNIGPNQYAGSMHVNVDYASTFLFIYSPSIVIRIYMLFWSTGIFSKWLYFPLNFASRLASIFLAMSHESIILFPFSFVFFLLAIYSAFMSSWVLCACLWLEWRQLKRKMMRRACRVWQGQRARRKSVIGSASKREKKEEVKKKPPKNSKEKRKKRKMLAMCCHRHQ